MAAGSYAESRYEQGLKSWRGRKIRPFLARFVPPPVVAIAVAGAFGGPGLWFVAGATTGLTVAMFLVVWWLPPDHVVRWRIGADGERATAAILEELEGEGWQSRHDIPTGRGNFDHVVCGPNGVYMLETKNLRGCIAVENGVLTTRQRDDERRVHRYHRLPIKLREEAAKLSRHIGDTAGLRAWVQPVVVVWGEFGTAVEADGIWYVPGRDLARWLRDRTPARAVLEFA